MKPDKIFVTKPFLPPLAKYVKYLEGIWERDWLTNNGPLVQEFESELRKLFSAKHVFFITNGTIALQLAIRALQLENTQVITTPFSFVASTSSLVWENATPVFADIEPENFCLDPNQIKLQLNPKVKGILGVHVYGYPCQVDKIQTIADEHHLKVIYDASHAFGLEYQGQSIMNYGDISTISFHATKLFHTVEGGALVTNNDELARRIELLRDFGLEGNEIVTLGINGKVTEFHAAMGLTNLPYLQANIQERGVIRQTYASGLSHLHDSGEIFLPQFPKSTVANYAYYPVVFKTAEKMQVVKTKLEQQNIFPRRYFYPSLNTLNYVTGGSCPVSESISTRVLCLPFYNTLALSDVNRICQIINSGLAEKHVL